MTEHTSQESDREKKKKKKDKDQELAEAAAEIKALKKALRKAEKAKQMSDNIRRSPRLAGLSEGSGLLKTNSREFDGMPPLELIKTKRPREPSVSPPPKKFKTEKSAQSPRVKPQVPPSPRARPQDQAKRSKLAEEKKDASTHPSPKPRVSASPKHQAVKPKQQDTAPQPPKKVEVLPTAEYQEKHAVTVILPRNATVAAPEAIQTFEQAGKFFPDVLMKAVAKEGFVAPSPIQAMCWPIVMGGNDIIAIAKTGSGKTCGFLFPALMHISKNYSLMCKRGDGPVACVLAPTRELACQIETEALKFAVPCRVTCACIYGGVPKGPQIGKVMRGIHVLIATPGRLNDFLAMESPPVTNMSRCTYMVLDEADRMLDMGFEPQIRQVFEKLPTETKHQTLMFSATWPKAVQALAREFLTTPVQINIGGDGKRLFVNDDVTQEVIKATRDEKEEKLVEILKTIQSNDLSCIVFANMKSSCDRLASLIRRRVSGLNATSIHGDKDQFERTASLKRFTEGKDQVIVATDVAARGLDIKGVSHVINYDFPSGGVEDWVHRVGRTGRAGKKGFAYTLFSEEDDRKSAAELVGILTVAKQTIPDWLTALAQKMSRRFDGSGRGRGSWGGSRGRGRGSWSSGGRYGGGNSSSWRGGRGGREGSSSSGSQW